VGAPEHLEVPLLLLQPIQDDELLLAGFLWTSSDSESELELEDDEEDSESEPDSASPAFAPDSLARATSSR